MQLEGKSLLIRADASTRIGTGHLMRCLALAQWWQAQGGQATFVTACESRGLRRRLTDEGFQVIATERSYPESADWEATSEALAAHPGAWVVLDGYHFDSNYQRQIREAGHPLLVIDDMAHLDHYYADVILNQNINAGDLRYSCEPYTHLLLGTRYVLLRSEFLAWRGWQREIPKVARKVLVTMGGGDPDNQTLKVIQALQQVDVDGLEVTVVVGVSNPHLRELQSSVDNSKTPLRLVRSATDMPGLMASADVAISAGGSTCWELAFMGLPSIVIILAENQEEVVVTLATQDIVHSAGWFTKTSSTTLGQQLELLSHDVRRRTRMSVLGRTRVDGLGGRRVIESCVGKKSKKE